MSGTAAATHGDAGTAKLMAHGGPGNAQLGTDLAQTPTSGVQVGCTSNVHGATVKQTAWREASARLTMLTWSGVWRWFAL
jgi:hypothetical protein